MQIDRTKHVTATHLKQILGKDKAEAKRRIILKLNVKPKEIDVPIRGRSGSVFLREVKHYDIRKCLIVIKAKIKTARSDYIAKAYVSTREVLLDLQKNWFDPHDIELTEPKPKTIYGKMMELTRGERRIRISLAEKRARQEAFIVRFNEYNKERYYE